MRGKRGEKGREIIRTRREGGREEDREGERDGVRERDRV